MRDETPTPDETAFFGSLAAQVPGVQDWYHRDIDGTLWILVSFDVLVDGRMESTWRCDYDGVSLVGGLSPSNLNWDDGMRAAEAGIDTTGVAGLEAVPANPMEAADIAAQWFGERIGGAD